VSQAERVLNHLMTERELQDNVIDLCKLLGLLVYHTHDSRRSEPGFPDLTICGKRNVLFVELKRQGGKLSKEQKLWGEAVQRVSEMSFPKYRGGVLYFVWRPAEWRDGTIEDVLRAEAA
jgi:hypothetical protein